jgi:hypothetical protein
MSRIPRRFGRHVARHRRTIVRMQFDTSSSTRVDAAAAFDAMADARNEVHWNTRVTSSRLVSDEPVQTGSKFRTVNRGQTYDAVITTYERPSRLAFEVTGKQLDITSEIRFSPAGDTTAIESRFDFRPKGFMKVIFPLMRPMVARDLPVQMERFAAFCEQPAAPSS